MQCLECFNEMKMGKSVREWVYRLYAHLKMANMEGVKCELNSDILLSRLILRIHIMNKDMVICESARFSHRPSSHAELARPWIQFQRERERERTRGLERAKGMGRIEFSTA